jgi:hypothetical protein
MLPERAADDESVRSPRSIVVAGVAGIVNASVW